jgi:hypothetical protein
MRNHINARGSSGQVVGKKIRRRKLKSNVGELASFQIKRDEREMP